MPCETSRFSPIAIAMLNGVPGLTGLLVLFALVPGLASWWRGRALIRLADDAALPERLLAARRHHGAVLGAVFVLLIAASVDSLPWTLPLLAYASVVASYPLRKALFGETWSLARYVWFVTRLFFGIWGFWIALILMPMLAGAAGSFDAYVAIAMAIVLTIWNVRYAHVLRWVLGVRPIEDPALLSRFHAMVQASGIPMPRFERVDLHGGAVANALALPSLDRSSVLFSETLLDRLEPDETVAICAHELAHLEHFNAPFLRRLRAVDLLLIASGAAVAPVGRFAGLSSSLLPLLVWVAAFLVAMVWRARDRQRNETASDLRAVAVCGNSEALVRGLTRLYSMARVPRRLDSVYEQRATHPSLARRIRDIRAAAGTASASLGDAASFAATDGRSVVTFENDKLQWSEGEGAVHSLSYAYLAELRLDVRGTQPASLVALERAGRRWELALAPADVPRAQAVLDVVDARLPTLEAPRQFVWPKMNRIVLAFVAMLGLTAGQIAVAFVTLLAVLQPAPPLVAAAGVASLTAAGLLVRNGGIVPGVGVELSLVLAALGVGLLYIARSNRAEPISRRATMSAVLLGACATLSVAGLALGGFDAVRIHQSARSATAAPVLLLAFGGALAVWRSRIARYAAIPVIMVAAATSVAASSTFLDRFGDDPFLAPAEPIAWKHVTGAPVKELTVPFIASGMQLSPAGSHVAVTTGEHPEQSAVTFHVGRAGDTLTAVVADDLAFVDDEHVVVIQAAEGGLDVSYSRVDSLQVSLWRAHVADVTAADLSVMLTTPATATAPATHRWRVMGWNHERQAVRAEGLVGAPDVHRTEWSQADTDQGWMKSMASSGSEALFVESRYDPGFLYRKCLWRWMWLFPPDTKTVFRVAGSGTSTDLAVSRLDAACFPAALGTGELLCSAFDGTRTRFIAVDPASKRVAGVAWMDGRFYAAPGSSNGEWVSGWRDRSPIVVNMPRRQAVEVADSGPDRVFHVAGSERMVGTLSFKVGGGSVVRVYRMER